MGLKFGKDDWKKLSIKDKVGQTYINRPNPEEEIKKYGSLKAFIDENPIGGMCFLNREGENFAVKLLKRYKDYLSASKIPLSHNDDMESGAGCNILIRCRNNMT
jgi:beta-N-acetylhexosaminidase